MIDPNLTEVVKLSQLPFLEESPLPDDILLVTHQFESMKLTIDKLLSDVKKKTFIHSQLTPSSSWSITHNRNEYPSVIVVDSGDSTVIGEIDYIDMNNITLTFSGSFSGKAYLN